MLAHVAAALGIDIHLVDELPNMEQVQEMAAEFFQRGTGRGGRR